MGLTPIGGLSSGMDTEEVIRKLIEAESLRKNMETRRKEQLLQKQTSWQKVKTQLQTLRAKLDSIRFPSSFRQRSVSVSDETVATATVSAGTTLTTHELKVKSLATAHQVKSAPAAVTATEALGLVGNLSIKVGAGTAVSVEVKATDSLTNIKDNINKTATGVSADLVKVVNGGTTTYQLVVTSKTLGTAGVVSMESPLLSEDKLKFKDVGATAHTDLFLNATTPTDAVFRLNGQMYTMSTNDITDVLPGLSFTLKKAQAWPDLGPEPEAVKLTVGSAPAKSVTAVKDWVTAVNETLSLLAEETRFNTSNGASGVLNSEPLAKTMQQKLRSMLSEKVAGLPDTMNQLSQIGVSTGKWGTADYGKLVVDEAKLSQQLTADPDGVARVFGALTDTATTGPAKKMYEYVDGLLKFQTGDLSRRDEALTSRVKDLDKRILSLDEKLKVREEELRRQFTRMEQAMSRLQSQGNAFMSQILSMSGAGNNNK